MSPPKIRQKVRVGGLTACDKQVNKVLSDSSVAPSGKYNWAGVPTILNFFVYEVTNTLLF